MIIGVTGNIGAGKSTVVHMLKERLSCAVIDADEISHELLETSPAIQQDIRTAFGMEALGEDGRINRKKLGRIVFGNPESLNTLNRIFYPELTYSVKMALMKAQRVFSNVILDAALIIEWGMKKEVDKLIVVTAPRDVRLDRLMTERRMLEEDAIERVDSQAPEALKIEAADIVVHNEGDLEKLSVAIDKAISQLGLE